MRKWDKQNFIITIYLLPSKNHKLKQFQNIILFFLTGSETPRATQANEPIVTIPQTPANEDVDGNGLSYVLV